ncbi:hypothetical protein E7Z59_14870 [Robertkochia marina]|uniref:Uncharacterized protein n=1 Tax=Robertkochia marina TaxID=1227945 RepID=A0A4V3UXV9_9FLAO|nr:hypothetical protein [Robertkochia marina]THD65860.1 hypothetical protein E7Z59_14870 [Robertkochia marina]
MKYFGYGLFLLCLLSCSGSRNSRSPEIKEEIPLSVLNAKGIAAYSENYKQSYFHILPYLFFNEKDQFIKTQGDYYHLKYPSNQQINIMPGYFREYRNYRRVLIVLISNDHPVSNIPLRDLPITVTSGKFGDLSRGKLWGSKKINEQSQSILFYKELDIKDNAALLEQISEDVITVKIENETYLFLNPEYHPSE